MQVQNQVFAKPHCQQGQSGSQRWASEVPQVESTSTAAIYAGHHAGIIEWDASQMASTPNVTQLGIRIKNVVGQFIRAQGRIQAATTRQAAVSRRSC